MGGPADDVWILVGTGAGVVVGCGVSVEAAVIEHETAAGDCEGSLLDHLG